MPNQKNDALNEHSPAQMVGGMRVKQANHVPLKHDTKHEQESDSKDMVSEEEAEKMRQKALLERQEREMAAEKASRDANISKNAGNNVNKTIHSMPIQPRSQNH
ncbi:uncharacterized protein BYT42DRAFT_559967 [Radiomyces spectabilis]|uniref:uncharacterized protein n=1 Tax=Radiomyces spectabilis TaxID=64574 RepID=UPI002220717E|nr:uncharacterized protein BYT42DRAFT_559967 [Radiomyces spectabilis]KAI8388407.1 hypothetical protein BYT42DRAFT_559967 [Radiomyces spectabilis]